MATTYNSSDTILQNNKRDLTDNSFPSIDLPYDGDGSVRLQSTAVGIVTVSNPTAVPSENATLEAYATSVNRSIFDAPGAVNTYISCSGEAGAETLSIRQSIDDTLRDLTARAISVESTITSPTTIVAPTIEGNGVSLVQFGITGDEFLDIVPVPGQAGENRGVRCLYTLFRDLPGAESDKKLYYDSGFSTRLLVDNQANQIAYVSDITNNFTGAVTLTDGTTTSTLEQNTGPGGTYGDTTGLAVSDNLLVGGNIFIGSSSQILANLSTDSFQINLNTPQNTNGLMDCNLARVFLTSDASASNKIVLAYDSATRASFLDGSTFDKIGDIAYTSDIYGINYSASAYTGTTWTTNYSGAITTAWSNKQIVQIDPASNNEQYTINTSTLDTNNKLRVWNISTQNHNAHVVVNGITYVVGQNTGLTAIKTPNSYSAFVGV